MLADRLVSTLILLGSYVIITTIGIYLFVKKNRFSFKHDVETKRNEAIRFILACIVVMAILQSFGEPHPILIVPFKWYYKADYIF